MSGANDEINSLSMPMETYSAFKLLREKGIKAEKI